MSELLQIIEKFKGSIGAGDDPSVSVTGLSSVMSDRFRSELSKLGIEWDGQPALLSEIDKGGNDMSPKSSGRVMIEEEKVTSQILVNGGLRGIGIDLQLISDFPESDDYWKDRFYSENFRDNEIGYASSKANPVETFAGIYSAKEAIFKANNSFPKGDIQITYEGGKPSFEHFAISISHSGSYALAVAVDVSENLGLQAGLQGTSSERSADIPIVEKENDSNSEGKNLGLSGKKVFMIATGVALFVEVVSWCFKTFL